MKRHSLIVITCMLLVACGKNRPHLEQIKERGELRVLSRYGPTSYYVKNNTATGFEYELAQAFAKRLHVKLKIIVPTNLGDVLKMIESGKADIAAAGLTITPARKKRIHFGPVYHEVTQQLVYRRGSHRPKDITDIQVGQLEVVANSSHAEQLHTLRQEIPGLTWIENNHLKSSDLLELVQLKMIDYTIADSNELTINQTFFPELRSSFDISAAQPLAWAMPLSVDTSLYKEVAAFFADIKTSGMLDRLIEKYYGHIQRFDYVDTRAIHRRIITHLPQYQALFEEAGKQYGFDWRLLAGISYQESHWNAAAVSSTGVKGLMMLTQATAKQMEITDRENPRQSIFAGAKYLASIKSRLPGHITEPDRTWIALAAYNAGLGHVEDARVLTEKDGKNPDLWSDIRNHLPWLEKKKWFSQTKYGYTRGSEPVKYVSNIRRYYDILLHQKGLNSSSTAQPDNKPEQALPSAL